MSFLKPDHRYLTKCTPCWRSLLFHIFYGKCEVCFVYISMLPGYAYCLVLGLLCYFGLKLTTYNDCICWLMVQLSLIFYTSLNPQPSHGHVLSDHPHAGEWHQARLCVWWQTPTAEIRRGVLHSPIPQHVDNNYSYYTGKITPINLNVEWHGINVNWNIVFCWWQLEKRGERRAEAEKLLAQAQEAGTFRKWKRPWTFPLL